MRAIMQVHDELVFEVHESVIEEASQRIRQLMEGSMTLAVPLKVDVGVGMNWDEAHDRQFIAGCANWREPKHFS